MWAEWDRRKNNQIPANISKKVTTTLVADNIDWKNKHISGKETHNTNMILVQHELLSGIVGSKVNLKVIKLSKAIRLLFPLTIIRNQTHQTLLLIQLKMSGKVLSISSRLP